MADPADDDPHGPGEPPHAAAGPSGGGADADPPAGDPVGDDPAGGAAPTLPLDPGAVDERLRAARGVGAEPPRRQASATWALVAVVAVTALFVVLAVWYVSG